MAFTRVVKLSTLFKRNLSTSKNEPRVVTTVKNGIRLLRFSNEPKKNALTFSMYDEIAESLTSANSDAGTKIVAITGNGDYFTSGNDLKDFVTLGEQNFKIHTHFSGFVKSLIELEKPLIALVNGTSIGAGVTMLGLCDTVYASDKAIFITPFSQWGLTPECCSSYTFPRILGPAKANDMLMFNRKISVQEALDWGLVSRIIPDSQFGSQTSTLLEQMAALPAEILRYSKSLVRIDKSLLHKVHQSENDHFDAPLIGARVKEYLNSRKK